MRRAQRGSALVEGVLVMTLFVGLLSGVLYVSAEFHSHHSLAEQLRWAARAGAVQGLSETEIRRMVVCGPANAECKSGDRFQGLQPGEVQVVVERSGETDARVVVQARGVRMECPLEKP